MMRTSTIAIVGAGQSGSAAALRMRELGFSGRIVLIGDETYAPYERPPLSKGVLLTETPALTQFYDEEAFRTAGIEWLRGERASSLHLQEREVSLAGGRRIGFDQLLLATGGRARLPTLPGSAHAMTLRTFDDALRLRARLQGRPRVVILGAGVVGLEVASSAAELGCSVEVLERGERLMARHLPPALSSHLADAHRSAGVKLRFGVETTAIERLRDGRFDVIGNFISEPANVIVAGVGMEPNIDLAAAQGLPVRRGIVVDAHGRTGCAGIYACGDVAEFYHERQGRHVHLESWQHATQHARSVASNMCGVSDVYAPTPWSWTDQHGLNIQMLGDASAADTTVLRGLPCSQRFVAYSLCEGRVVGATLVNQGRELRHCRALIESGATPDLEQLQDPSVDLRQLL